MLTFLQAQENGVKAEEYFGQSAERLAQAMIVEMPEKSARKKKQGRLYYPIYLAIAMIVIYLTPIFGGSLSAKNLGAVLILIIFNFVSWSIGKYFPEWAFVLWPDKSVSWRERMVNDVHIVFSVTFIALILIIKYLIR